MRATALFALFAAACNSAPPPADTPTVALATQAVLKEDFEKENPKWAFTGGKWERRKSGDGHVLSQTAPAEPWSVALLQDKKYADLDLSVRVRPISGNDDQTGGLVFRAKDARSYYLVRSNGLEDNFRLYTMIDGKRKQLASTKVEPPKVGAWHTLRVVAAGPKIQAYVDGKLLLDRADATFAEGFVGLWTKADSITDFDDLEVRGDPR